jgi:methylaspartate ammonia-lyase
MAKYHQTENPLFKALTKKYESQIATAAATLIVYFDNPVGIGEHPQHIEEMDKLVGQIASAEDNLKALNKYFNNTQI